MMSENYSNGKNNQDNRSQDCCCSSENNSVECCQPGKSSWLSRIIFGVVILAAITVGVYSLAKKSDSSNDFQQAAICGINLNTIASLEKLAADKDVIFILLADENEEQIYEASIQVESIVDKLLANSKRVSAFTLKKNAEDYSEVIKQCSIESIPCVVVWGSGCMPVVVAEDFSEARLMNAYVQASTPMPACIPGKGSSCCPK